MKKLLLILLIPMIGFGQQTYVPDDNFESYLESNGMGNGILNDNYVTTANINIVTYLNVTNKSISDLTGIEDFTALTSLDCFNNQLTSLDVSNNTALVYLYCFNNQLTSLDVSNNTALTELVFENNQLTSLDVSNNTALTILHCYNNQLTSLDVSNNTALVGLWCSDNQLTSLDVRNGNNGNMNDFKSFNNPNLSCISVDDPAWSTTNWSNIDATTSFAISCSQEAGYTYVPDDNFEQALINLGYDNFLDDYVYTNSINSVNSLMVNSANISDLTGIEGFTALTILDCDNNQLTNLDVSNNTSLTFLRCSFNQLTSLDVSNHTALTQLTCYNNQLTSLDVNNNTSLTRLYCGSNQLTSLDVSNNTALTQLTCYNNQLTSIDVSNNTALTRLDCDNNQLTNLDVSNNTSLTFLRCSFNQLTSLDVSNHTLLSYLLCQNNQLTSLDFNLDINLWTGPNHMRLNCANNNLTTLNLSGVYLAAITNELVFTNNPNLSCIIYGVQNYNAVIIFSIQIDSWTSLSETESITHFVVACDSYTWNGTAYANSGVYTHNNSVLGCDSILSLTINNSTSSTDPHVACDSFIWNCDGNTYTESNNTATYTYTNAAGCDSVVTLDLTINNSSSSTDTHIACDEFMWSCDGNIYTESNSTATYTYTNAAGCDSVVTLDLTINNSSSNTTTETTCDSYVWLVDGNTYTTSGTYTEISVNSDGCDHTEILELTVSSTLATISQSGDSLFAVTTPIGLNADWYNIQTEDSTTSIWLMQENSSLFSPRFDCSYFIVVSNNGCVDTSSVYYYGQNAARIGSIITSPNPTSGLINVKFDNPKNQFVMLELISNNGFKLDEFITTENSLNIDLSKYPSGSYYLYFNSEAEAQGCRLEKTQKTATKIILNK